MLAVLRPFLDIFRDLTARHGPSLLAAYTDTLHEAQALLRKVDREKTEEGRATDEPPAAQQNVTDSLERHPGDAPQPRRRMEKLA